MAVEYAFGIDIGGTTVKIGIFTDDGKLDNKWEIPTRTENNGEMILDDIAGSIRKHLDQREISTDKILGIGIDVPGPVLGTSVVNKCVNLGWGVTDVASKMRMLTEVENVLVANDANAAALGEMWQGGGQGHDNVVMITLGTGVGGGIILNGQIVEGNFGAGGEIGHMIMNPHEKQTCGCGKKGHLEQYASATGIVRRANEVLAADQRESVLRKHKKLTAKDVYDAAKAGDQIALEIADFVGHMLGLACARISCVIDPEIYVIGGGVSKAGDILLENIKKHFVEEAFHASEEARFALATLGNDAGMYGSVKMVL